MKKKTLQVICLIVIMGISLSACNTGGDGEGDVTAKQTLTALSHTQTAFAQESQAREQEPVETEVPAETEEIIATEPGVEEEEEVEETESPTEALTEIAHTMTPGEPGWVYKWFYDTDASKTAENKYVSGGDDFVANLFERPFTEDEMVYRPDIDINKTEISSDDNFFYVTLYLNRENPDGGLHGIYGVELDFDLDGRGDMLILADHPSAADWDIAGVSVHSDPNGDVGGSTIMRPDSNYTGDGYEQVDFSINVLDDPDAAWARVDLDEPSVTLAFKKSLFAGESTFVWGVWAADSLLDSAMLDLHDHYTQAEAGSPYQSNTEYPIAAINLVDNTCRETYGFDATAPIPGLCYKPQQEPTSKPPSGPDLGSISYVVFYDSNYNGRRDAGESLFVGGTYTIRLLEGSCSGSTIGSSTSNSYTFGNLEAGNYCVVFSSGTLGLSNSPQQPINLSAGGSGYAEFGIVFN